ncbi:MAG: CPP1-like family protein, partial [Dolichospermum sp.]
RVRPIPQAGLTPSQQAPEWLQRSLDRPTLTDVLLPGFCYLGLGAVSLFYPGGTEQVLQLALVVGVGAGVYFLNRKEGKFGRSVLFTLVSLIIGLTAGSLIAGSILPLLLPLINLTGNQFSTLLTFIFMWLVSSFLR